ncbi:conserved unknown protein [Ectocarpus siliculosus]|uniref:40S ribosomal protein S18 n=1 Tax=Ectocarpus siliculosus TaxID=2880 RepID=D8LGL2_ECTSI|nr:conserved unknown protein [Ectocarpus siliculosus]|eukprot:CBN75754.1 conserved unknown protein [Ectocarpus siliculosus]
MASTQAKLFCEGWARGLLTSWCVLTISCRSGSVLLRRVRAMSLVISPEFQHILRILNTNIDGRRKVQYSLTSIRGVGRRFANLICKKAEVDPNKRAGEMTADEIEKLVAIIQNPRQFKIPDWFLNRQKDWKTGKTTQISSQTIDQKLRDDLERLKKIRSHRGIRHYWGVRVRGQHTKTTGRRGKIVAAGGRK